MMISNREVVFFLNVLFLAFLGQASTEIDNYFFSVTRFQDIERFYLRAKKQKLCQECVLTKPMLNFRNDRNICHGVLDTMYFKNRGIYPLDLRETRIQDEIAFFYPQLYKIFFTNQKENDDPTLFLLPYAIRKVRQLNQTISQEGVVICLARVLRNYLIKQFFISLPYQPHRKSDDGKMYFVFKDAENSLPDILAVEALAEEPPSAMNKLGRVEMNYLSRRWEQGLKPTKRSEDDYLCSLPLPTKLRICASIASSEKFRDELEFVPTEGNVQPTCVLQDVFLYGLSKRGGSLYGSEGLSEWMFSCAARRVGSYSRLVNLYVSRSYESKTSVLVYRRINDRHELVDYFKNINALYRL